ncbi:uncharacterized protein LOC131434358 [Malaya genurostris]|uniref:uncharacterized protein LOC131434358 n=1 Tax=Malaya genurostris TaxID=325434 RepID=UPI0026F38ADF|nr:uncharacterized protein LOC131434358 [Malaya genurostris]
MNSSDEEFFVSPTVHNHFFGKKKVIGIHPINLQRRKNGEFQHLYYDLRKYPDRFYAYTRMSIETFDHVLSRIESKITKEWTNFIKTPIFPCEKLIITLRFLATGASFSALGFSFRIGRTTAGAIVKETCTALWDELFPDHMPAPSEETFLRISNDYWNLWNFPNCIGALDGKHNKKSRTVEQPVFGYRHSIDLDVLLKQQAEQSRLALVFPDSIGSLPLRNIAVIVPDHLDESQQS